MFDTNRCKHTGVSVSPLGLDGRTGSDSDDLVRGLRWVRPSIASNEFRLNILDRTVVVRLSDGISESYHVSGFFKSSWIWKRLTILNTINSDLLEDGMC